MDFLSKQVQRLGKSSENFEITFKPLLLKVNVTQPAQYYLVWKRGPTKSETKKYLLEQSGGFQMQELHFEGESFAKVSSIYKEKDGRWQEKKAEIQIRCQGGL